MTVLRKRFRHYAKLPSSTIRDERLSDRALGVLLRIADLPDNWTVRADVLAAGRPQGRDATAAALRNLAQCGYYRVERRRLRNGRFQMGTAISEEAVPEWEAEYLEFEGKPIPLVEQPDGTFLVLRKDGSTTDDGFTGIYAPGAQDLPMPHETPGHTGNGKSGFGKGDLDEEHGETDISGHGFPGSGEPDPGVPAPISNKEKYGRDVAPSFAGLSEQLSLGDTNFPLRAVGELQARNARESKAPTAQIEEQAIKRLAWQTATLLPRRYREHLPEKLRFPIINDLSSALRAGVGQDAILRYAAMCASDPAYAADRHLPLLRHALRILAGDINTGQCCRRCGTERDDVFGPPCDLCRPDACREQLTESDLAELERARAFLGVEDDHDGDHAERAHDPAELPPMVPLEHWDAPSAAPSEPQSGDQGASGPETLPPAYSEATGDLSDASDTGGASDDRGPRSDRCQGAT